MKTQDIIMYAVLAAAAYIAYRWLVQQGMIPDLLGIGGGTQVPGGSGQQQIPSGTGQQQQQQGGGGGGQQQQQGGGSGSGGNGQSSSSGAGSNTTGGGTASGSIKEQVDLASRNEAIPNAGLLHFWKWNYYLPSGIAKPSPFDLDWSVLGQQTPANAAAVESTPLTLDQWWSLVQPQVSPGVAGLGRVNHWGQQPSQWHGGRQ